MTPQKLSITTLSVLFSFSAFAAESAEPIPSTDVIEIQIDDDASARKQAKKSTRKRNAQRQRAQQGQKQRAQQAQQRRADQAKKAERIEDRKAAAQRASRHQKAQKQAHHYKTYQTHKRAQAYRSHQKAKAYKTYQARKTAQAHRARARAAHSATHVRPHRRWAYRSGRPVRWYHGVFVYGPAPHRHQHVRGNVYKGNDAVPMPKRKIDRRDAFSVGLTSGSYMSGYSLGGEFSDFGLGVNARFRPVEGLGFELAYSYHDDTFEGDTERMTAMLQPSVQVFAAPWSRVSPYASVGVTFTERQYNDNWTDGFEEFNSKVHDQSFGPHAGIGLEIALGQNAAIDFETRAIGYLDTQEGDTLPGAIQTTFGAQWYF